MSIPVPKDLNALMGQYRRLTRYCDRFFDEVMKRYPREMVCRLGCSRCCQLESVNRIEAWSIRQYLAHTEGIDLSLEGQPSSERQTCVFLKDGACRIYPVRPLICRTHGLLLFHSDTGDIRHSCDLNFTRHDLEAMDPSCLLDAVTVTENLMRLNMAFALIWGHDSAEDVRVSLKEILLDARKSTNE